MLGSGENPFTVNVAALKITIITKTLWYCMKLADSEMLICDVGNGQLRGNYGKNIDQRTFTGQLSGVVSSNGVASGEWHERHREGRRNVGTFAHF